MHTDSSASFTYFGIAVGIGMHDHGFNAQLATGTLNTQGNLAGWR